MGRNAKVIHYLFQLLYTLGWHLGVWSCLRLIFSKTFTSYFWHLACGFPSLLPFLPLPSLFQGFLPLMIPEESLLLLCFINCYFCECDLLRSFPLLQVSLLSFWWPCKEGTVSEDGTITYWASTMYMALGKPWSMKQSLYFKEATSLNGGDLSRGKNTVTNKCI